MKFFRTNIFAYHSVALFVGLMYFYGSNYGFNFLGMAASASSIFEVYHPSPDDIFLTAAINFLVAFLASLAPALALMTVLRYVLNSRTKLFLIGSALAFSVLSVLSAFGWSSYYHNSDYLISFTGKALGGLVMLWFVVTMYLRYKLNKANSSDRYRGG